MMYRILHAIARFIFKIYFNFTKIGLENIPKNGGFVVTPNHKSFLDIPIVGSALTREMYTVAKKELFEKKFQKWFYRTLNGISVDRNAYDTKSVRKAIETVRNGNPILIFPEGTRYEGEGIGKGKRGPAFIAASGRVPILPVGIAGTDKALPKRSKFPKPSHVVIVFGKPFNPWEIFEPNERDYLDKVTNYLMKEVEKCRQKAKERL